MFTNLSQSFNHFFSQSFENGECLALIRVVGRLWKVQEKTKAFEILGVSITKLNISSTFYNKKEIENIYDVALDYWAFEAHVNKNQKVKTLLA